MRSLPEIIALQIAWSLRHHAPDEPRPEWATRFIHEGKVPSVIPLRQFAPSSTEFSTPTSCDTRDPRVVGTPQADRSLWTPVAWWIFVVLKFVATSLGAGR